MKRYTLVANWKIQLPLNESVSWISNHKKELINLGNQCELIICPETIAIAPIHALLDSKKIFVGAQNCSKFLTGAFTGEISVHSLVDAGVTHCIVGHYERRHYFHETDEEIAQKCLNLATVGIIPILCIGALTNEHSLSETLEKQLHHLKSFWVPQRQLYIAYEPPTAIEGDQPAPLSQIIAVEQSIREYLSPAQIQFLYGGSVNSDNAASILAIPGVDGILLGRASLDFQNLKKIVSSLPKAS